MDKLKECTDLFSSLLNTKYNIVLGRKGVLVNICITFKKGDFHHLIGLQYLTDIPQLKQDREKVFNNILNNNLTYKQISKSHFFNCIEKRILAFVYFENFLDSNHLIFKYNRKANPFSKIEAEFLLMNKIDYNDFYIFIDKMDITGEYYCRSFFPRDKKDYSIGQANYTLLFKEKINAITQMRIIQYDRLTPKE